MYVSVDKDALKNENEINVYFHHEVDPIPGASNEDDLDDVLVVGHEEGKF